MAVYKVPQDVEAEDKLIGPFGFRQFIYLLIAAGAGGLTFLFFRAPIPIPFFSAFTIPVIIGMIVLALPLRKDQPMEIYLAAVLRFMLKPKKRLWANDGTFSGIIINAPQVIDRQLSRDISQQQALDQLSYLSRIVDTHGWAAKGVDVPGEQYQTPVANLTTEEEDVLDEGTAVAKSFDSLLARQKEESRKAVLERMKTGAAQPSQDVSQANTTQPSTQPSSDTSGSQPQPQQTAPPKQPGQETPTKAPRYNPYPNMHQQVLSPIDKLRASTFHTPDESTASASPASGDTTKISHDQPEQKPENADNKDMTPPISPDIMRLANNNDLSIQTIANEAHRAEKDEVVVNLH